MEQGQQPTEGHEEDNPEGATRVTQGEVTSDPLAKVSEVEGQEEVVSGEENLEGEEDLDEEELDEEENTDEDEYLAKFINKGNPVSSISARSTGSVQPSG